MAFNRAFALFSRGFLLAAVCCSVNTLAIAAGQVPCVAIELSSGSPEYNRILCEGLERMQQKRYGDAVLAFESAMEVPLFEVPNFALYPRLALAHYSAGNYDKARDNLSKAELALSVLIQSIRCEEKDDGFRLIKRDGTEVNSQFESEISKRMCGAAYESYYTERTFDSTLRDAKLIELFYRIKNDLDHSIRR